MSNPSSRPEEPRIGQNIYSEPTACGRPVPLFLSPDFIHKVPTDQLGFHVLVEPDTDVEVDIIAVQGLGAIPSLTWTDKASNTNWLADRHMLPARMSKARIMTYGYDSIYISRNPVRTTVEEIANGFLLSLDRQRKDNPDRPIIFVGHCFGGLVVEKALILSKLGSGVIAQATAGILFLGTPHRGTKTFLEQGDLMRAIALAAAASPADDKISIEPDVLQGLRSMRGNLVDGSDTFATLCLNMHFKVCCVYEERWSKTGKMIGRDDLKDFVVDKPSAILDGQPYLGLPVDHFQLNKFNGPDNGNYIAICERLEEMYEQAMERKQNVMVTKGLASNEYDVPFSLAGIPVTHRFVARNEEMNSLKEALLPKPGVEQQRRVFVLHGLGGIGKTQLAIEFARKHQHSFSAALWLDGSSRERMMQSVADLARRLPQDGLHEASKQYVAGSSTDVKAAVDDVLSWFSLRSNSHWLLVIDNVDREYRPSSGDVDAFDVRDFFPAADHGSILITSRLASLRRLGAETKLGKVNEDQAKRLMDSELGQHSEDLSSLIDLLDGLPLALIQAGSYMRETGTSAVDYIRYYNSTWDKLMQKQDRFRSQEYGDRSVWTTWAASVEYIRKTDADTVNLLILWAFLDNRDAWYELFSPVLKLEIAEEVPEWLRRCVDTELNFRECMQTLTRFSLVDSKVGSTSFSMHAVLHQWCRHNVEGENKAWQRVAVETVAAAAPSADEANRPALQRRLLSHCDQCLLRAKTSSMVESEDSEESIGVFRAWGTIGNLYSDQGRMKEAEEMYLQALSGFEKAWGSEHTSTLNAVNNLGISYWKQGRMKEAEEMFLRALSRKEKVWGAEHTSTLNTVNNLGNLYLDQGRIKEAEEMYLRALSGYEKAWGAKHTSTLDTVNNLGNLYRTQGRIKEAEEMYLRALSGYEKAWGAEHKTCYDIRYNLACLYRSLGQLESAKSQFELAAKGYDTLLGSEHAKTIDAWMWHGECF